MSRHQKRLSMPKTWNIQRKTRKWAVKASPGPHSGLKSIPLLLVLRDVMKLANSSREAKKILHDGNILVDLCFEEDSKAQVDMNVVMNSKNELIEVQSTAEITPFRREDFDRMMEKATAAIAEIIDIQKKTLNKSL